MTKRILLLPFQREFMQCKAKFVHLNAGLGTGKSDIIGLWSVRKALMFPKSFHLLAANSHKQLNTATVVKLYGWCRKLGLKYHHNRQDATFTLLANGAQIHLRSMENYDDLRGTEYGSIAVDEFCYSRPEAANVAVGRLRCKHTPKDERQFASASTPNGYDHVYDMYMNEDTKRRDCAVIHGTSYDNLFLGSDYCEMLEDQYSAGHYRQEVLAEIVANQDGLRYSEFNQGRMSSRLPLPPASTPIYVGMDFNVNPMTAILLYKSGSRLCVFDEIFLENANSYKMVEALDKKLRPFYKNVIICPDASGASRKTSSSRTDHDILREGGYHVESRTSNPRIKDRVNNVNRISRKGWLVVDPRCKMLLRDLNRMSEDVKDKMLGHITDALGYALYHIHPYDTHQELKVREL